MGALGRRQTNLTACGPRMLWLSKSHAASFQQFAGRAQQGQQAAPVGNGLSKDLGLGVDEIILGLKNEESGIDAQSILLLFGIEPFLREAEGNPGLFDSRLG